jgi:hypothetical protein
MVNERARKLGFVEISSVQARDVAGKQIRHADSASEQLRGNLLGKRTVEIPRSLLTEIPPINLAVADSYRHFWSCILPA